MSPPLNLKQASRAALQYLESMQSLAEATDRLDEYNQAKVTFRGNMRGYECWRSGHEKAMKHRLQSSFQGSGAFTCIRHLYADIMS